MQATDALCLAEAEELKTKHLQPAHAIISFLFLYDSVFIGIIPTFLHCKVLLSSHLDHCTSYNIFVFEWVGLNVNKCNYRILHGHALLIQQLQSWDQSMENNLTVTHVELGQALRHDFGYRPRRGRQIEWMLTTHIILC